MTADPVRQAAEALLAELSTEFDADPQLQNGGTAWIVLGSGDFTYRKGGSNSYDVATIGTLAARLAALRAALVAAVRREVEGGDRE